MLFLRVDRGNIPIKRHNLPSENILSLQRTISGFVETQLRLWAHCTDSMSNFGLFSSTSSPVRLTGTNNRLSTIGHYSTTNYTVEELCVIGPLSMMKQKQWFMDLSSLLPLTPLSIINPLSGQFSSVVESTGKSKRSGFCCGEKEQNWQGEEMGFSLTRSTLKGNDISLSKPPNFNWASRSSIFIYFS